jgi:hypothetical protein
MEKNNEVAHLLPDTVYFSGTLRGSRIRGSRSSSGIPNVQDGAAFDNSPGE